MKRYPALCVAAILLFAIHSASAQVVTLRRGTTVHLAIPYPVSIATSTVGQPVPWTVADDVVVNGVTVVAKGATAMSRVSTLFTVGGSERRLSLQLETVATAGGGWASLESQPDGNRILNFSTARGNDAVVAQGTEITVFIASQISFVEAPAPAPAPSAATPALLRDGTPVKLQFPRVVSTMDDKAGDRISFEVTTPVLLDPLTPIPKGSTAWGTVTEAKTGRDRKHPGQLSVTLDAVILTDGQRIPLRAVKDGPAGALGLMVFSPGAGAAAMASEEGNELIIQKGQPLTAYVNGDVSLNFAKPAPPPVASAAPPATAFTQAEIGSSPSGADIQVDGKFVGNTPSSIKLASGEHEIRISKAGYRTWTRKLTASEGSVKLFAQLTRPAKRQVPVTGAGK